MLASELINRTLLRLKDEDGVRTTRTEVLNAIREGLHFINVFSFYRRSKVEVSLPLDKHFFNLLSLAELDAFLDFSKTIAELLIEIKTHLAEEDNSSATINEEVYDISNFNAILQLKVFEFLKETGLILTEGTWNSPALPIRNITFTSNVSRLLRLSFTKTGETDKHLIRRETEETIKAFSFNLAQQFGIPKYYSDLIATKNEVNLYPSLDIEGVFNSIHIEQPDFSALSIVPVPTNLAWVIKYGILYEFFSKNGDGYDPKRADYCKNRWEQGLLLAKNYFSILQAETFYGKQIHFSTIEEHDNFDANWYNKSSNKFPSSIMPISWNLFAIPRSNTLASDPITLRLSILSNTIIPSAENSVLDISNENISALEDYVYHYCLLKDGDEIFYSTIKNLSNFIERMVEENKLLNIPKEQFSFLRDKATKFKVESRIEENDESGP